MEDVEEGKALRQDAQRKRVLIPGCGTGYDVEYFARLGFGEARGVDIAPEATKAAQAWADSLSPRPEHYSRIHLETVDYLALADTRIDIESQYDVAYDYTFFCALPPSLRPKWAKAHANNLKAVEGMLITVCFPMQGDRPGGPPVSTQHWTSGERKDVTDMFCYCSTRYLRSSTRSTSCRTLTYSTMAYRLDNQKVAKASRPSCSGSGRYNWHVTRSQYITLVRD
jgi:SAM-dependent methyltransferase